MRPADYPEFGPFTSAETELVVRSLVLGDLLPEGHVFAGELHTPGHIECPACEAMRLAILTPDSFAALKFQDAAAIWLDSRRRELGKKSQHEYEYYIRTLAKFFGELTLKEIHIGHFMTYQQERGAGAGPSLVNHELNCLKQILEKGQLWGDGFTRHYRPLRMGKAKVGLALEEDQEKILFETAAANPMWKVAYWGSLITAGTGADPGEITHLHLNDVQIGGDEPSMCIRDGLKNVHRDRIVRLKQAHAARWALGQILKRYYRICRRLKIEPNPEHYILPSKARRATTPNPRRGSTYDPWKAMGSWRKSWEKLRKAAGLGNIRRKDLRHHAITKMLENPEISEQTIEEIVGHVSQRMKKRYSHIRAKPMNEALASIDIKLPKPKPRLVRPPSNIFDAAAPPWERDEAEVADLQEQRSVQKVENDGAKRRKAATGAES